MELSPIRVLPQTNQVLIPESYIDEMGHMNIQYYFAIVNQAAWACFGLLGADLERVQREQKGIFALEQHIRYLSESRAGQTVTVYSRFLARSEKRMHFIHFLVNEEKSGLTAILEGNGIFMDMTTRKSAPWPADIAANLDAIIAKHAALPWEAPICGAIRV